MNYEFKEDQVDKVKERTKKKIIIKMLLKEKSLAQ